MVGADAPVFKCAASGKIGGAAESDALAAQFDVALESRLAGRGAGRLLTGQLDAGARMRRPQAPAGDGEAGRGAASITSVSVRCMSAGAGR